jgi:tetratricopeptide (TPR) repeat protein
VFLLALLWCICACPCTAYGQQPNRLGNSTYKNELIDNIAGLLESKYVLPDRAKAYAEEFRSRSAAGLYDSYQDAAEFATMVTADLVAITNDSHISLRVIESSDVGENTASSLRHPIRLARLGNLEHLGFYRLDWIDGNIGYLDLRRFYPLSESKEMVDAAMRFLAAANAIIIDLRENQGGAGESLPYFCSYFFEYPTQLTGHYSREDDFLTEFWTAKDITGERRTDVPLFLLTSDRTFSAAEAFAYDMKVRNRATLIGDSTKGGAHSVDLYQIDDQFEIYISTARAINPVTSGNWEGTGVIPNVVVTSESALDTAIVLARTAAREHNGPKETRLRLTVDKMQTLLDQAELLYSENKTSEANTALDSVFRIGDEVSLINEFFLDVLAYNYLSETDEQILYAILQKRIEFFPESSNAYEALAYAYYMNGRNELAIECYEKVLQLDPENPNAARMIRRLQQQ